MSATRGLGRNARLFYNNAPIGYGKNISVKAKAVFEQIQDYLIERVLEAANKEKDSGTTSHTL